MLKKSMHLNARLNVLKKIEDSLTTFLFCLFDCTYICLGIEAFCDLFQRLKIKSFCFFNNF